MLPLSPIRYKRAYFDRRRAPCRTLTLAALAFIVLFCWILPRSHNKPHSTRLIHHFVKGDRGGGTWVIPPSWSAGPQPKSCTSDTDIVTAAECVLELSLANQAFLKNSQIPLIVHQTWYSLEPRSWPVVIQSCIERWLEVAVGGPNNENPEMAWFLWDDAGIDAFMEKYEPELFPYYQLLPYPVEKADVFRVMVLKWFGGVYADVDARPITHPYNWVLDSDLLPWADNSSTYHAAHQPALPATLPSSTPNSYLSIVNKTSLPTYSSSSPIGALFGIGADNLPPPDDTYWRMGYFHPVQITNWALSMAPHHPVANQFAENLVAAVNQNRTNLYSVDPLEITGPPALTVAIQAITRAADPAFIWQSLSGRDGDPVGGRGKVIAGDTLIMPITGFHPGRGRFHNMGSQSISHPNARLRHAAAGSWRNMDPKVHWGKFCRVAFGLCRDWKKISDV